MHPFAVVYESPFYADALICGLAPASSRSRKLWDSSYYTPETALPLGPFSNGSQAMDFTAEYYCNSMFSREATTTAR